MELTKEKKILEEKLGKQQKEKLQKIDMKKKKYISGNATKNTSVER